MRVFRVIRLRHLFLLIGDVRNLLDWFILPLLITYTPYERLEIALSEFLRVRASYDLGFDAEHSLWEPLKTEATALQSS